MANNNVKSYDSLSSDEKTARKYFSKCFCTNCLLGTCNELIYAACINGYTKGFSAGVKHHRKLVKNKKK